MKQGLIKLFLLFLGLLTLLQGQAQSIKTANRDWSMITDYYWLDDSNSFYWAVSQDIRSDFYKGTFNLKNNRLIIENDDIVLDSAQLVNGFYIKNLDSIEVKILLFSALGYNDMITINDSIVKHNVFVDFEAYMGYNLYDLPIELKFKLPISFLNSNVNIQLSGWLDSSNFNILIPLNENNSYVFEYYPNPYLSGIEFKAFQNTHYKIIETRGDTLYLKNITKKRPSLVIYAIDRRD